MKTAHDGTKKQKNERHKAALKLAKYIPAVHEAAALLTAPSIPCHIGLFCSGDLNGVSTSRIFKVLRDKGRSS